MCADRLSPLPPRQLGRLRRRYGAHRLATLGAAELVDRCDHGSANT